MKKIICLIVVIGVFSFPCFATEPTTEIMNEIESELITFKNSLPKEIIDFLPKEIWEGDFSQLINGNFNEATMLDLVVDYLFLGLRSALNSFAGILIIIVISSIFNTLSMSFSNDSLKATFSLASTLCIAISVFNICTSISSSVNNYIMALCSIMEAFSPLMVTLYLMTGNISSAAISSASFMLFISIIERFLIVFMLPIINICICFNIMKCFGNQFDFSGLSKILKNTFTGVTIFVMSIFMFVLSTKNVLTQTADSISIKTAKFAISSFIPIVGSTVNEALRTITASMSLIKNSCGIIAIIAITLLMLPVIISLILNRLLFNITSSITKALNCNTECSVIDEASSICGFLLALVLCTCILFIFALTILIKSSVVL